MLSVHGDCHLAQTEEKTPIREKNTKTKKKKNTRNKTKQKKERERETAGALCVPGDEATSSCLSLSLSLLVPVRMKGGKKSVVLCFWMSAGRKVKKEGRNEGRKEGRDRPADFPRPIPWFSRTSSLPWRCCASYVAGRGNLVHSRAEGRPAELHTLALTAPVQTGAGGAAAWLPGWGREGGGGVLHTHAHVLTHRRRYRPAPLTSLQHRNPIGPFRAGGGGGFIMCSAVMWEPCKCGCLHPSSPPLILPFLPLLLPPSPPHPPPGI